MLPRSFVLSTLFCGSLTACSAPATTTGLGNGSDASLLPGRDAHAGEDARSALPVQGGNADAATGTSGLDTGIANKCGELSIPTTAEVVSEHGNVLIVFDQSNSMTTIFSGKPLWQSASDAVREALTPHKDNLTVGSIFFPTASAGTGILCVPENVADIGTPPQIPFQEGTSFLQAWADRWTTAGLVFGTPTSVAMTKGDEALTAAKLEGPTVVLLVTDGASTCYLSDTSAATAAALNARGILTYVIGLPGSGPASSALKGIADAGGTKQLFTPDDSTALTKELGRILGKIVKPTLKSCDIQFNEVPERLDEIVLVVTETETGERFRVLPSEQGWQPQADNAGAKLLGSTCQDALNGRFSDVSFEFGCGEIPIL
jgi:hypothetical protein